MYNSENVNTKRKTRATLFQLVDKEIFVYFSPAENQPIAIHDAIYSVGNSELKCFIISHILNFVR